MSDPLSKVDEAVEALAGKSQGQHRDARSVAGVYDINDLEAEGTDLEPTVETQKTGWKINQAPTTIEDASFILKVHLVKPPVKRIDLLLPGGEEVTARNLRGVTIKDALDAIHKVYKEKADDELEKPYLAGFEWDKEESWTQLVVHLQTVPGDRSFGGRRK